MELRDYQVQAIDEVRALLRQGRRQILLCAPTGSGKTVIAAKIVKEARSKGKRVLFLAHRRELIAQIGCKLTDAVPDFGVIMSGHNENHDYLVQIGSIQTLIRRKLPPADILIIDEAHRAVSRTYLSVVQNYPKAVILGLSATPERSDKKGMDNLFTDMVIVSTIPKLVQQGYLVAPVHYCGTLPPDLKNISISGGDYKEDELNKVMDDQKLIGDIVTNWQHRASTSQTVVFASGVEHAKHITQSFQEVGIKAAWISGDTPDNIREEIINRWKARKIQVVSNCMVLTEGFDYPELECVILARPTKSLALYLQCCGRVMRPAEGKKQAVILDHAECYEEHGPCYIDREWILEGIEERDGKKIETTKCIFCQFNYVKKETTDFCLADEQIFIEPQYKVKLREKSFRHTGGLEICPRCRQTRCLICGSTFKAQSTTKNIDNIASIKQCRCDECLALYETNPTVSEGMEIAIPKVIEQNLEVKNEIPLKVLIRNDYKKLLKRARREGKKRGWVYHKLVGIYNDRKAINDAVPKHTADWWRRLA